MVGTTYDAKKETAEAREKKQNQLKKIEEAKKREKGAGSWQYVVCYGVCVVL